MSISFGRVITATVVTTDAPLRDGYVAVRGEVFTATRFLARMILDAETVLVTAGSRGVNPHDATRFQSSVNGRDLLPAELDVQLIQ